MARQILPEASAALFLDDRPYEPLESRKITEWDSSCCLFALRGGTIVKIPESNLILPSVTIQGICAELIELSKKNEVVAICSIGTAGILSRAQMLLLVDETGNTITEHNADETHELYQKLGEARTFYWDIYKEKVPVPDGLKLNKYVL